jgi:hypothetical protein
MNYIDTSVLAAFYIPETSSGKVQAFLGRLSEAAISTLTEVELHSAVARRVRARDLTEESALKVFAQFRVNVDAGLYRIAPVERRDYALARDWLMTFSTPLRTLDAVHLAVAFSNGYEMVTSDRTLAAAAEKLDVPHRLIV